MAITTSGTSITFNDATTQTTAGVTSITAGTGISSSGGLTPTITNSGVTSIVAGTGISISGATGAVTVTSTVTSGQYQYSMASRTTAYNSSGTPMVFVSTGSFNWTCPTGVTKVRVIVIAGGGGGHNNSGDWGGAGGQAQGVYTVSAGTVYSVTVGAGGAGTGSGTGGTGGSSSFSTLCTATGGTGATGALNGTSGTGSSGNISNTSDNGTGYYMFNIPYGNYVGSMFGGFQVNAPGGSQTAVVWTPTSSYAPGAIGGPAGAGGVSGAVLIEYVG